MWFFSAGLDIVGINPFVYVPPTILATIFADAGKDKGHIPVRGMVNGKPYEQTLLRYKGEWRLYINAVMLPNSPKRIGEIIEVSVEFDPCSRTLTVHPDLAEALAKNLEAQKRFKALSPSAQKEIIRYIGALKTAESRARNIEKATGFLLGINGFLGRGPKN